jgi:hypothetical protein
VGLKVFKLSEVACRAHLVFYWENSVSSRDDERPTTNVTRKWRLLRAVAAFAVGLTASKALRLQQNHSGSASRQTV